MHSEEPRGFFRVQQWLKISLTLNVFPLSNVLAGQIDSFVRVFWHRSHLTTAALKSSDFAANHRVLNLKQILVKRVYAAFFSVLTR